MAKRGGGFKLFEKSKTDTKTDKKTPMREMSRGEMARDMKAMKKKGK